jgi:hypothetical protein
MANDRYGNDDTTPDGSKVNKKPASNVTPSSHRRNPNDMTYEEIIKKDKASKEKPSNQQRH